MNPIRIVYQDTPSAIPVPEELQHARTEIIIWPLDTTGADPEATLKKGRRRSPPAALAGKVRELGDVMSSAPASDWGTDP